MFTFNDTTLLAPSIVSNPSISLPLQATNSFSPYTNSSLSSPLPLPQPSSYPMVIRSKASTFKPKTYLAALLSTPIELISIK